MKVFVAIAAALFLAAEAQAQDQAPAQTQSPARVAATAGCSAAANDRTLRSTAAEDRPGTGHLHRRGAVRRRMAAARAVASRPQPGHDLGADSDGQVRAAGRSPRAGARQRRPARRGLWRADPPGHLLRLAERGLCARGLRAGLHRAEGRHGGAAHRGPAPSRSCIRRRTRPGNERTIRGIAPKFAQLTNEVVFDTLWRRSDLSLRDRSLVTIAALAAMGDDDQLDFYLRRGVESGLTREQIAEALTHLGFYAGWSKRQRPWRRPRGRSTNSPSPAFAVPATAGKPSPSPEPRVPSRVCLENPATNPHDRPIPFVIHPQDHWRYVQAGSPRRCEPSRPVADRRNGHPRPGVDRSRPECCNVLVPRHG